MIVGGPVARAILNRFRWSDMEGGYYEGKSKLELCFGPEVWEKLRGRRVLDFGCGDGVECAEISERGVAREVIGLDINAELLARARRRAPLATFSDRAPAEPVDVILSVDSFEHFARPEEILASMWELLAAGGRVLISFGPPWYHPWGSHCLIFPWAHLVFTERSIMEWRERYKHDGAKRYAEGSGAMNQMTVARFERMVGKSPFRVESLRAVPIRRTKWAHNRLTREFLTACVRAELVKE
jgi:SAM-dependent methyltransferase